MGGAVLCRWRGAGGRTRDRVHFEMRLLMDMGDSLGINADHVQLARLDKIATQKIPKLTGDQCRHAEDVIGQLFDVGEVLKVFLDEVNKPDAQAAPDWVDSFPGQFCEWANRSLALPDVIFDEESLGKISIDERFAVALLEFVFLGAPQCHDDPTYRGHRLHDIFRHSA